MKLTLPETAAIMAVATSQSKTACENFLREFATLVAETLEQGESVKVKGLGTFKVSEVEERKSVNVRTGLEMIIPAHRKVTFLPDKALAEKVNAPFAMFDPVELSEEVSEEMLNEAEQKDDSTPSESEQVNKTAGPTEKTEEDPWQEAIYEQFGTPESKAESTPDSPELTEESEPNPEETTPTTPPVSTEQKEQKISSTLEKAGDTSGGNSETIESVDIKEKVQQALPEETTEQISEKVEVHVHSEQCRAPRFRRGLLIGALCSFCFCALILGAWRLWCPELFCLVTRTSIPAQVSTPAQPVVKVSSDTPKPAPLPDSARIKPVKENQDLAQQVPTVESDASSSTPKEEKTAESAPVKEQKKVYDTISTKRFLTTMAKEHYGDYNLWPYIYDENRAILGHPDRIKPGTKVVIPPAEKYGINAKDPACVVRAKRRGAEIYSRYR